MIKRLVTMAGLALSAALLYWMATRFSLQDAFAAVGRAHGGWFAVATFTYLALFVLRGWRWALLLRPIKPLSVGAATEVFAIGFMANNLLPARLGDVVRAYVLARQAKLPTASSLSSVLLERIFDGVTVVAFLNLALLFVRPTDTGWLDFVRLVSAAVFVGAIIVCGLIAWSAEQVRAWIRRRLPFVPAFVDGIITRLGEGLHTLRSPRQTAQVAALSVVIWSIETLVYIIAGQALGIDVGFWGMALVMAVLTLGITLPSAPGSIGVFEGAIVWAIGLSGLVEAKAVALALAIRFIHFVPGTLAGLFFAWRSGLKLAELRRADSHPSPVPATPNTEHLFIPDP